jgi:hypothetical protein
MFVLDILFFICVGDPNHNYPHVYVPPGSGFISQSNPDPAPHQNVMDLLRCI